MNTDEHGSLGMVGRLALAALLRLAITLTLTALAASATLAAPTVDTVPTAPRPGEVVFVTLTPEQELARASCAWRGKSYAFLPFGDGYRVLLPVAAGTKPGGYHAVVWWRYADGQAGKQALPVQVKPRRFGIQRLTLSAAQEKKYSSPDTAREYRLIGAALRTVTPECYWQGDFLMPVEGRVSTSYGLQRYVNGHFDYRHKGMDLACPQGTPVAAAADGVVTLADPSFHLHGQTIIVDHGQGVSTLYLHLSEIDVTPGQVVKQGEVIGKVGKTGVATGPHLHYGVYVYHEAVDPEYWTHLPAE
jgi:murein DD-endopeptidase MepM/ murein hydrolase activator NlpD